MAAFKPDLILAIGGGSAMDAGKIMWVLYEHPEADFQDMAMRFVDIRKRVYTFPKMGEKAYFVAIPTTAGTGSEVTPFAVITDETTGVKYPLADYELLPKMSIVDADMMMNAPKGLTAASGIDAVTHALEAYASMMATDYTDGLALRSLKLIFEPALCLRKRREGPQGPREHGERRLHGRYGLCQRIFGRVPLHGAQAGRVPPSAPRRCQRPDDRRGSAVQRRRGSREDGHLLPVRPSSHAGAVRRGC